MTSGSNQPKPFGLRAKPYTVASINWRPSDGLRIAQDLEKRGLVTISLQRSHCQRDNEHCINEYWLTYLVEITPAGRNLLDNYYG